MKTTNRIPSACRGEPQAVPSDPTAVYHLVKRVLFAVARRVRQSVRLKLEGHGRGEAEAEELVNDAFIALLEALPRWDSSKGKLTTFAYGLASRRMWLVARAEFYGLSPEQLHRMDVNQRTPRYHHASDAAKEMPARQDEAEPRVSVRRVAAIRRTLSRADRRQIDLWLEEGGNVSAVSRRTRRNGEGLRGRYRRLFRRIRWNTRTA